MKGKVCATCASTEALDIHHVDPAQKIDHRVFSWRPDRMLAELEKCIVLCRPCHNAVHHPRRPVPHGTHSGYSYHGCRCSECTAAHAAYNRRR